MFYFPGSLAYEVTNREALRTLCPRADDVWLYWMSRMAGTGYRQVGGSFKQIPWPTSQRVSLYSVNVVGGQNDVQICAMEDNYGLY